MHRRKVDKILAPLLVLVFSLFFAVSIYSQVTGATLSGTVSDASGGGIPGATISIKNTATGISQNFLADSAGYYTAPNLIPGTYDVGDTGKGFRHSSFGCRSGGGRAAAELNVTEGRSIWIEGDLVAPPGATSPTR